MNRHQSTGYLLALGASLALAATFVFSKSVLNHLTMVQFGLFWFSLGVIWNSAWFLTHRDYRELNVQLGRKTAVAVSVSGNSRSYLEGSLPWVTAGNAYCNCFCLSGPQDD